MGGGKNQDEIKEKSGKKKRKGEKRGEKREKSETKRDKGGKNMKNDSKHGPILTRIIKNCARGGTPPNPPRCAGA